MIWTTSAGKQRRKNDWISQVKFRRRVTGERLDKQGHRSTVTGKDT